MPLMDLSDANPDGTRLGQSSTDKVSFYGATPVVRPAAITAISNTATGTEIATAVNALRSALTTLGLTA